MIIFESINPPQASAIMTCIVLLKLYGFEIFISFILSACKADPITNVLQCEASCLIASNKYNVPITLISIYSRAAVQDSITEFLPLNAIRSLALFVSLPSLLRSY